MTNWNSRFNQLRMNVVRLQENIDELGVIGSNEAGGLNRIAFSPSERSARAWLQTKLSAQGLAVNVDAAANIWGLRLGKEDGLAPIVFGSHLDTVPNGGKYDGALGVLLALEAMTVLNESSIATRHPLEIVSFSAEEPNPYGFSTFGSRCVAGKLGRSALDGVRHAGTGQLLTEALSRMGGDPGRLEQARRIRGQLAAFLEVHIEQGRRLLDWCVPVGVVTAISGIYREEVTVLGDANHAGTTLMRHRNDALTAACEIILAFEAACREQPADETVGTVGRVTVEPNAANIIPGKVTFTLEIRGNTRKEIQEVLDSWEQRALGIASRREIGLARHPALDQPPVTMDAVICNVLEEQADRLGCRHTRLGSMAGHDAAHMASIAPTGMLFVPSIGGRSHCPDEESRMEDIGKAGNILLHSLLALDQQLDR